MKCYRCNNESISREHAPPMSFFPSNMRNNLITVPSCAEHNMKKTQDDEYIRLVIASSHLSNQHGFDIVTTKGKRSLIRNNRLINEYFSDLAIINFNQMFETGTIKVDMNRWDNFFNCLASALYYENHKVSFQESFNIINYDLFSRDALLNNQEDPFKIMKEKIDALQFTEHQVHNPDVFRYLGCYYSPTSFIYKMIFYGGFRVFALYNGPRRAIA